MTRHGTLNPTPLITPTMSWYPSQQDVYDNGQYSPYFSQPSDNDGMNNNNNNNNTTSFAYNVGSGGDTFYTLSVTMPDSDSGNGSPQDSQDSQGGSTYPPNGNPTSNVDSDFSPSLSFTIPYSAHDNHNHNQNHSHHHTHTHTSPHLNLLMPSPTLAPTHTPTTSYPSSPIPNPALTAPSSVSSIPGGSYWPSSPPSDGSHSHTHYSNSNAYLPSESNHSQTHSQAHWHQPTPSDMGHSSVCCPSSTPTAYERCPHSYASHSEVSGSPYASDTFTMTVDADSDRRCKGMNNTRVSTTKRNRYGRHKTHESTCCVIS